MRECLKGDGVKAVTVAAAKPTAVAIVDATPLRFAPHAEENTAPETTKNTMGEWLKALASEMPAGP